VTRRGSTRHDGAVPHETDPPPSRAPARSSRSVGPDAGAVARLLGEALLTGAVLGLASWTVPLLVAAVASGAASPPSAEDASAVGAPLSVSVLVALVTAVVGAVVALAAASVGLAVVRVVDPRRDRPRARLVAGAVASGVVTGALALGVLTPTTLVPGWFAVVAALAGTVAGAVLLARYERRRRRRDARARPG